MPRIAILPPAVADQIAAGEVVERPSSIVKELVENAFDAGATTVEVEIEDGGRQRIRVSDDGSGMDADDATLALARHATSKIRQPADLVGVASFGFRGEALPSICSVSELAIESSTADGEGTSVRAVAGTIVSTEPAARRRGTTIEVTRLFHNAPARRKFLRGGRSEWRSIMEVLTNMALTRRDVRLQVVNDGKQVLSLPRTSGMRARVAALWGAAYAGRMVDVEDVSGTIHVSGLAERPFDVGTSGRRIFTSVNGRPVRDHGIVRAAEAAYRTTIPGGVRPTLFLELTVAAEDVDVNVHPAKAEVRFRDRWTVERAVEAAVRRALGNTESAASFTSYPISRPQAWSATDDVAALRTPEAQPVGLFLHRHEDQPATSAAPTASATLEESVEEQVVVPPLLQLRRTYMMFEHDSGVVLIDQHAAHERILYERFMRVIESGTAPSQQLLFPLTLHLGPAEEEAFEANRELLERIGFEVEGFGGNTLIIRSVPNPHPRFDAERCLRETLDALAGDRLPGVSAKHEKLAATVACKAAVKAGDPLSAAEMRALFIDLSRATLPAHDVHGRATIVQLSWDELERRFGRR
jgi:DNA mismatch repair protein MutL